jgi:hypothetical protein
MAPARRITWWLIALLGAMATVACGDGDHSGKSPFGTVNDASSGGGSSAGGGDSGGDSGTGLYSRSGTGDDVFTLPTTVDIVRVTGTFAGSSQSFIVQAAGASIINEVIGTAAPSATHEGVYWVSPGAQVQISNSAGVDWRVSSESLQSPVGDALFVRSGSGDMVFDLPSRIAAYRIQATYPGAGSNFIVHVDRNALVNELLGTSWSSTEFAAIHILPASGRVEITNSSGVVWSFTEL